MEKANCYKCIYRGTVPGDAHSCCCHPEAKGNNIFDFFLYMKENKIAKGKLNIKGNQHGINMGWFMWPCNFDPVWLENCDGFTKKE